MLTDSRPLGRLARQRGAPAWPKILSLLSFAAAAFVVVASARMMVLCRTDLPLWDQWDNLVSGRDVTWQWLVSFHNEHRLLLPRLIFVADGWWFSERNRLELCGNLAFQGATAAILSQVATRLAAFARPRGGVAIGFIVAWSFSMAQWGNLVSPFQVQFFMLGFAAVAAFAAGVYLRPGWFGLATVILLDVFAVFSMGGGLVVPLVSVGLALALARPWRQVLVLAIVAGLSVAAYAPAYHPAGTAPSVAFLSQARDIADYIVMILSNAPAMVIGEDAPWLRWLGVSLGLAGFLALLLTPPARMGSEAKAETVLLAIAGFVLALCLVTALGRVRFGIDQANSLRYTTPVLLFWVVLLCLGVSRLPVRIRIWGLMALVVLTLLAAIRNPRLAAAAWQDSLSYQAAAPALVVPNGDLVLLSRLYPLPDRVLERRALLLEARSSIFSQSWALWVDHSFPGGAPQADLALCQGEAMRLTAVSDGTHSGWRATGRLAEASDTATRLIFLDAEARVVGIGVAGLDALAADDAQAGRGQAADRWLGEIEAIDPAQIRAYRLDAEDHPLCRLAPAPSAASPLP